MAGAPIALLGGTFDPVHNGHLGLASDVRRALALSEVRLVPAGDPPHREGPSASGRDRLAMLRLAVADQPGLVVDPREVLRPGKSYTVLTLEELRQGSPARPLLLLVGADAFLGFPTWHRWKELFALAHIVVVARPGVVLAPAGELGREWKSRLVDKPDLLFSRPAGSIYVQPIAPMPVSATEVRAQLARGAAGREAASQSLPPAVLRYIDQHHLYHGPIDPQDAT
ncbi:MAG: nicotinate-nucleotide adenylyltransferase [Burkholderiales bacterium]